MTSAWSVATLSVSSWQPCMVMSGAECSPSVTAIGPTGVPPFHSYGYCTDGPSLDPAPFLVDIVIATHRSTGMQVMAVKRQVRVTVRTHKGEWRGGIMGWDVTVPAVLNPDPSFLLRSPLPSALGRSRRGGGKWRCSPPASSVGAAAQHSRRWARLMEWLSGSPSIAIGIP